ncbi:MAG TPA: Gfo/Idh/MocA family oxidoreductase [Candidatus Saccharimonadales bacterium]|nr:Gfo/Idh/MocA family oxidoreductase [Candidatus Saccharimonadales bacterium]
MGDRIGIGLVGAGGIARQRHVPGFRAIDGVELVGVVNRSTESSERAARDLGIARTYDHWLELIEDPAIDAIVVATWPYLHAPISIAALDAGKHVLTQARMAMNADEARAMLAASLERPDLVAMVVPSPLTLWADRTVERLLVEGVIGQLRSARIVWGGSVGGGPIDPWRRERRFSGNNVLSLGIVYEAVARWLGHAVAVEARTETYQSVGSGPERIVHVDVPDYVSVLAEFPDRVHATIEISAHAAFGGPDGVHLFGTAGTLHVDVQNGRLEIATAAAPEYRAVEIPPNERGEWRVEAEFIGAIRGQNEVRLTDFATGVRYMAFTDAVHEAAATGARVAL